MGPMPRHEWEGTSLRFEIAPNQWGEFVNLQGPQGKRGPAGGGGAAPSSGSEVTLPISVGDVTFDVPITEQVTVAQGTLVASQPITFSQTWDNAAVEFSGFGVNITDAGSHANSVAFEVRVDGDVKFGVYKNGRVSPKFILSLPGTSNETALNYYNSGLQCTAFGLVTFGPNITDASSADTGMSRNAAGVLEVNNGERGTLRDLKLRNLYSTSGLVLDKAQGVGIKIDVASPDYGWRDLTGAINAKLEADLAERPRHALAALAPASIVHLAGQSSAARSFAGSA